MGIDVEDQRNGIAIFFLANTCDTKKPILFWS